MSSRLRGWGAASVVAGLWIVGVVVALVGDARLAQRDQLRRHEQLGADPFALPWFLIPIGTRDHGRDAWVVAGFGLLNAALIFWWIAHREPVRSN